MVRRAADTHGWCDQQATPDQGLPAGAPRWAAVAAAPGLRNPCTTPLTMLKRGRDPNASLSLGRAHPLFLCGEGARTWSRSQGLPTCEELELRDYNVTAQARDLWERCVRTEQQRRREGASGDAAAAAAAAAAAQFKGDTVGAVVIDAAVRALQYPRPSLPPPSLSVCGAPVGALRRRVLERWRGVQAGWAERVCGLLRRGLLR